MADVLHSDELTDDEPSDFGSLRPGTRLGRYELLVPIARGGMARVWAARQHGQRGFQKLVAIKTILPHLAEEPEFERMFLDEARIASGVHHPNVCEIYELGEERRTLYLAMEWVNGDSLSRILRISGKTEAFDARVVSRIIADACAGVHSAHELNDDDGRQMGVVHRDLSPHNILLTQDGVAKVCDFGVAKALGQLHEQTSAGQLKGKISYMSPEQVTGAAIDRRSDVFSLGCVLYEATTGVRPFKGDRDHQIMHAIMQGEIEPPSARLRNYPPDLERIVMRALAHQPILRYPTAERMRFALEEFLTKGQLVTTANAAQIVRARLGEQLEKRKERIKQASTVAEQGNWDPANAGRSRDAQDHRSGVKASQSKVSGGPPPPPLSQKPFAATVQMPQGAPPPLPQSVSVISPATPRMGAPHVSSQQNTPSGPPRPQPKSQSISIPTPTLALDDDTIHGHGLSLPASSPTMPQAPQARQQQRQPGDDSKSGNGPPHPMGGPTLTLPIGPGALMSPLLRPAAGTSAPPQPQTPSDYSNPGQRTAQDWSSPGIQTTQMPSPLNPNITNIANVGNTIPPNSGGPVSGAPTSHPFGGYDQPSLAPEAQPVASPDAPVGAGQYAMAAFVGLLFAVLIGGGGFFVWHTRTTHTSDTAVVTTATATATATAPASSSSSTPASAEIAFRLFPGDATLTVDGRDLGTAHSIPRPAAGQTMLLVAKAKGYEDSTLQVDYFTNASLEITLRPIMEIDNAAGNTAATGAADAGAAAAMDPAGSASAKPKKPRPKDPNAIPENPY